MYQKIQELCKENNITVNRLEKELGFPRGYFYKWQSVMPGADKVLKVAKRLNVTVEEIMQGNTGL